MTTRAERLVTRGQGHWATCRKKFTCDRDGPYGPCLAQVTAGQAYFATTVHKYLHAREWERRKVHVKLRYCAKCADEKID